MKTKERAVKAWSAILTILAFKQDTPVRVVDEHLQNSPKPHVQAVQVIMEWSGWATSELEVDGDWGGQSQMSLRGIYNTTKT